MEWINVKDRLPKKGETIPLGAGDNPPAQVINPEYEQHPVNSRKCIECGKTHDTMVENMMTGERLDNLLKLERPETPPSVSRSRMQTNHNENMWVSNKYRKKT